MQITVPTTILKYANDFPQSVYFTTKSCEHQECHKIMKAMQVHVH